MGSDSRVSTVSGERWKSTGFKSCVTDLRSDTVTRPCGAIWNAIYSADVGDDVMGEDPTVSLLETTAAGLLGKESALFVPTGTMANSIAVGVHCSGGLPGPSAILGNSSHIYKYETGGAAQLWSIMLSTVPNAADGRIAVTDVDALTVQGNKDHQHNPSPRLVCLEQTQNLCGGATLGPDRGSVKEYMAQMGRLCRARDLRFHMDGARLCNAAVALDCEPSELISDCDSTSLCLSKGLGAPVGSILAGSEAFIHKSRRLRKMLGGGMRQAGVIAAGGLRALEMDWRGILAADHRRTKHFAEALREIDGFDVDLSQLQTNILYAEVDTRRINMDAVATTVKSKGLLITPAYAWGRCTDEHKSRIRFVFHRDVSDTAAEQAVGLVRAAASTTLATRTERHYIGLEQLRTISPFTTFLPPDLSCKVSVLPFIDSPKN